MSPPETIRILLVDDEPVLLRSLGRLFRVAQPAWRVGTAPGALQALELLDEQGIDVLVTDMAMDGMDGADLLEEVAQRWPTVLRVVFTGNASESQLRRTAAVAHQVLPKTLDSRALVRALADMIAWRDAVGPELRGVLTASNELPLLDDPDLDRRLRDPTVEGLAEGLSRDPALVARTLQLYGGSGGATRLPGVLHAVGIPRIRALLRSARRTPDLELRAVADHAVRTATLASRMLSDPAQSEVAFLGGLVHDLGSLMLLARAPELDPPASARAALGAAQLGLWGVDARVVRVVRHHTEAPTASFDAAAAVYLANLLIRQARGTTDVTPAQLTALATALGVAARLDQWRRWAVR